MNATPVTIDKESVRMLAIQIGVRPAARKLGLNEDRVCKWSERGNWFPALPDVQGKTVSTVSNPGDVLLATLAEHECKTKLGLAKFAKHAIGQINKSVHPVKYTTEAHSVAKTAAIVHRWDAKEQSSGNVIVNIALLGVDPGTVSVAPTLDVETQDLTSEGQDSRG